MIAAPPIFSFSPFFPLFFFPFFSNFPPSPFFCRAVETHGVHLRFLAAFLAAFLPYLVSSAADPLAL